MRSKTLTVQQVADYLNVNPMTIYSMVKQKEIPHFRVRNRIFFSQETIEAWIRDQESNLVSNA